MSMLDRRAFAELRSVEIAIHAAVLASIRSARRIEFLVPTYKTKPSGTGARWQQQHPHLYIKESPRRRWCSLQRSSLQHRVCVSCKIMQNFAHVRARYGCAPDFECTRMLLRLVRVCTFCAVPASDRAASLRQVATHCVLQGTVRSEPFSEAFRTYTSNLYIRNHTA